MTNTAILDFTENRVPGLPASVRRMEVAASDVLQLLKDPRYQLSTGPQDPPIGLLALLEGRFKAAKVIGPQLWENPKYVQKLEPFVLKDRQHQNTIDGYRVSWIEGGRQFRLWSWAKLFDLDEQQAKLFDALIRIADEYFHQRHSEFVIDHHVSKAVQHQNRLIAPKNVNGAIVWVQLNPLEYKFYQAILDLRKRVDARVVEAIAEGRVVGVEQHPQGDKFASIAHLTDAVNSNNKMLPTIWFLPTSQFDENWLRDKLLGSADAKEHATRQARQFIERLYAWGRAKKRRAGKQDVLQHLESVRGLSGGAAEGAWKLADIEEWKASGKIPADAKINSQEIKDLINGGEVKWPNPDYFD